MNKVILIGRLTKDIEVRATQSGKSVAMFNIAVDDSYGEKKHAYFPSIVVWDKQAELCGKYLHKGSKIAVEGKLTTRSYDNNQGKKVYVTEVVAGHIEFLDSKGSQQNDNALNDEEIPF